MEDSTSISNCENITQNLKLKQLVIIRNMVRKVGIPTNFIGYKYIVEALRFMINSQEPLFLNEVYRKVAQVNKVSKASIEVSIRNAIKKAILINNPGIKKIIKSCGYQNLSNSVFLNIMKELLIEKILTNDIHI